MNKYIPLSHACKYSSEKLKIDEITLDSYITTDNLLQNKQGVTIATNLPPQGSSFPKYNAGNILVGNIRPYLKKIWFADNDGGCSADVLVFDVKKGIHPKFIYYAMFQDDFFVHAMKGSKGTKMPRGDKNQIMGYQIPDIDLNSQKHIANVLSALDSKIALNNRINAELEAMAKTVYDYWFVQFDFPNAEGKPYKSSGGKMVWCEELKREIPEGWEVGTLLDIADYLNGLACQNYRPKGEESLRVIKIREMKDGFSSNSELVDPHDIPQRIIIENGDVLFSWSASLEVIIWFGGKGALNQHIFKVSSKKYPKSFYYFQLLNYLQHFKMMAENRKTTMGHITQEHLQQSRIAIPPKELTVELEKIIAPVFAKKLNNDIQNQQLLSLRDWLLPMLMNGQVRVGAQTLAPKGELEMEVETLMAAEPGVEYKSKNAQSEYYHKIQSVYAIIWANKLLKVQQGEMALAKDTYLIDKIAGLNTGFTFAQHNWGSYDPTFKKTINNKQYFVRRNFENSRATYFDLNDNEKLIDKIPDIIKESVRKTIEELDKKVFGKYHWHQKAEMKELYATVLKCIEDTQSIDMTIIRQTMKDWKTPKQDFPDKATKFSEQQTKETLDMIVKEGWNLKVIKK